MISSLYETNIISYNELITTYSYSVAVTLYLVHLHGEGLLVVAVFSTVTLYYVVWSPDLHYKLLSCCQRV